MIRKAIGIALTGSIFLCAGVLTSIAWAASSTTGLASLSLQGVGSGEIVDQDCTGIICGTNNTDICSCLTANYTVIGNQGFANGNLAVTLSLDTSASVLALPISNVGACYPAAGTGQLTTKNSKSTVTFDISGLECPTIASPTPIDVYDGTYVITSASGGKFSDSTGGTGSINGSQIPTSGQLGQVAIIGTLQPKVP
jgi:hypothetical protein